MKTLSIISQKGGAGKTTLAVHLAVAADMDRKQAALIDLDPQASAASWGDSRGDDGPVVESAQASRLQKVLAAAEEGGAKLTIIDTAPHSESSSLAAARLADFVLIPCRPAILDLRAIGSTVDLVKLAKAKASVVLNTIPPRGAIVDEAAEAIAGFGIPLAPCHIGSRVAFVHSLTAGLTAQEYEPKGKAAQEISRLYKWTRKQLGM